MKTRPGSRSSSSEALEVPGGQDDRLALVDGQAVAAEHRRVVDVGAEGDGGGGGRSRGVPVADRDVVARGDLAPVVDEGDEAVGDVGLGEGRGGHTRELELAVGHVRDREDQAPGRGRRRRRHSRSPAARTTVWPSFTVKLLLPRTGVSSTLALKVMVAAVRSISRGVPVGDRDVVARGDLASVMDEGDEAVGDVGLGEGGGRRARQLELAVGHVRDREDEARV